MREEEHLVRCGWPSKDGNASGRALLLCPWKPHQTITLETDDLDRKLGADIPDRLADLLEIAAYVHCADQTVSRGKLSLNNTGAAWRRRFRLQVQVREPDLWNSVRDELSDLLSFLADDHYTFEFDRLVNPPPRPAHLNSPESEDAPFRPDEVLLFSGGLDSLAGALSALGSRNGRVALISHRSAQKTISAQTRMTQWLRHRHKNRVMHIPVRVRKTDAVPDNDSMQRSRSFLFATLGVTAAHAFRLDGFRFYENGVVSLNLPIAEHVLGARATRTTHPQVLHRFARLFSRVLERPIEIENPFLWKTKGEVVSLIAQHGTASLIAESVSCAQIRTRSKDKPHCGTCSQCLSRRFAVLAAGLDDYDPADAYEVDLLTGERQGLDRLMASLFVRFAQQVEGTTLLEFATRFPELWRAVPYLGRAPGPTVQEVLSLHQRHSREVLQVLARGIEKHAGELARSQIAPSSLLRTTIHAGESTLAVPAASDTLIHESAAGDVSETWAAFDAEKCQVRIHGIGTPMCGGTYELLHELLKEREKAKAQTNVPFTPVHILAKRFGISSGAVRQRISRLDRLYAALRTTASTPVIPRLLETSTMGGYRLHPSLKPMRPTSSSDSVTASSTTGHKPAA